MQTVLPEAHDDGPVHFQLNDASINESDNFWRSNLLQGKKVLAIHYGCDPFRKKEIIPNLELINRLIAIFLDRFPKSRIVVLVGPNEEHTQKHILKNVTRIKITSGYSLKTVAGLISKSTAFLGSDSGLGHIAACFNIPIITLVGPTNFGMISKPWNKKGVVIQTDQSLSCMPCFHTRHYTQCEKMGILPFECLKGISEKKILMALAPYFS